MHDNPDPVEILTVATRFVRNELIPALPPALSFNARVLANALDLVIRQVTEDQRVLVENLSRLNALLGQEGPEDVLISELTRRIESGEIALKNPDLIDYLWHSTLSKIAVDQPRYASYRAEIDSTAFRN